MGVVSPFLVAKYTPVPAAAALATPTAAVGKELTVKPAGMAGKTAVGPVGEIGATGASFLHSCARRTTSGSYSFVRAPPPTSSR